MDDIEEKCEDNLTDSDSTPVLPNKSFILPTNTTPTHPSPLVATSEPESLHSTAAQSSTTTTTTTTTATNQSVPNSSTPLAKPSSPIAGATSALPSQQDNFRQAQGTTNSSTAATSPLANESLASGNSQLGNQNNAKLIGSPGGHSSKMTSSLSATSSQPPSKPSSSSNSASATSPGAASQMGSFTNPKYRIASSLSSPIAPSSPSTSSSTYKRMPHLHKLEK